MGDTVKVGSDGRLDGGRFAPGNRIAKGNPNNAKMQALRASLLEVAEPKHVQGVYKVLLKAALGGDVQAAKLVLEYTAGKPPAALDVNLGGEDGPGSNVVFAMVLSALAPYPEARVRVAAQLRALSQRPPAEVED